MSGGFSAKIVNFVVANPAQVYVVGGISLYAIRKL